MSELFAAVSYWVAFLFLFAAALKARDLPLFAGELEDYELLPPALVRPASFLIPAVEVASGVLVFIPRLHVPGCICLAALLLVFSGATALRLRAGRGDIRCACLGRSSQRLDWTLPVRNLILAAALVPGIALGGASLSVAGAVGALLAATVLWLALEEAKLLAARPEARHV